LAEVEDEVADTRILNTANDRLASAKDSADAALAMRALSGRKTPGPITRATQTIAAPEDEACARKVGA
jgi:hypothetical protein